jgi:hypothetical protein
MIDFGFIVIYSCSSGHFHAVDDGDTGASVGSAASSGANSTTILSNLYLMQLTHSRLKILGPPFPSTFRAMY